MLVVLPSTADFFFIWDVASRSFEKISLGGHAQQQELLVACWSSDGAKLAIGTSKGALLIFETTTKKVLHNVQGVHERVSVMLPGYLWIGSTSYFIVRCQHAWVPT